MVELKQAKIENGKICLDGKVIEADLMYLGITRKGGITNHPSFGVVYWRRKEDPRTEIEKSFKEHILIRAPAWANAYIVGERNCFDGLDYYYSVLYLKIKN